MKSIQYTIRAVPTHVDRALRQRAKREHKSLNALILESLERTTNGDKPRINHELDEFIGVWEEDPAFDEAMRECGRVDDAEGT